MHDEVAARGLVVVQMGLRSPVFCASRGRNERARSSGRAKDLVGLGDFIEAPIVITTEAAGAIAKGEASCGPSVFKRKQERP